MIGGSYKVDKKWWVPVPKADTSTDRPIPALLSDYERLETVLNEMKMDGKAVKLGEKYGTLSYAGEETINGIADCIKLEIKNNGDRTYLWVHPTQNLENGEVSSPIYVKIVANAKFPVLGRYNFELNLTKINGIDL